MTENGALDHSESFLTAWGGLYKESFGVWCLPSCLVSSYFSLPSVPPPGSLILNKFWVILKPSRFHSDLHVFVMQFLLTLFTAQLIPLENSYSSSKSLPIWSLVDPPTTSWVDLETTSSRLTASWTHSPIMVPLRGYFPCSPLPPFSHIDKHFEALGFLYSVISSRSGT